MPLNLPDSFLHSDEEIWLAAVDRALKGAPRARLIGTTEDGLEVQPLYPQRRDSRALAGRAAQVPWKIIQRVDLPDPADANAQLRDDLNGGADGAEIILATSCYSGGLGVHLNDLASMEQLFDGVLLDLIDLRLAAGHETSSILAMLLTYSDAKGLDPQQFKISAGLDIIGSLARRGYLKSGLSDIEARMFDTLSYFKNANLPLRLFGADGRVWHGAGATAAQELAFTFANALYQLRLLERSGIDPDRWTDWISFTLIADADQVGTIAKARAARRIWARILDACGLPQAPMALHMQTSRRMMTSNDPWVNILRSTVASFAAGVGGADSFTVLPFTMTIGLPDGFARRIARNTQSILIEESNLHQVADPSAGSGAIEARTDGLVEAAWDLLQQTEAGGGLFKSLLDGKVQDRIAAARQTRDRAIAKRRKPITGVSEFPDLQEKPVPVLEPAVEDIMPVGDEIDVPSPDDNGAMCAALRKVFRDGVTLADTTAARPVAADPITVEKVPETRIAQPFEDLREAAARSSAGTPPVIFLACLGPLAQFTARATWTANAFAAGGIGAFGGEPKDSLEDIVAAFKETDAKIAVLVSSDKIYETEAEAAASALKQAGADYIYLAGKPGETENRLRNAGVDTFIYAGCNLLDLLREVQDRLGLVELEEGQP